MKTFLPEAHYLPWNGQYLPTYRWYREKPFVRVPKALPQPSARAAINAAKDYLAAAMAKQIKVEHAEPLPDLGQATWRAEKAKEADAERARVFARMEQAIGFAGRGKQFVIERRRRA